MISWFPIWTNTHDFETDFCSGLIQQGFIVWPTNRTYFVEVSLGRNRLYSRFQNIHRWSYSVSLFYEILFGIFICVMYKMNGFRHHEYHIIHIIYGLQLLYWVVHVYNDGHEFITITSQWARRRLKSQASRLFIQPFIQAQMKESIKAPRHWPLRGEFTADRWIPRTKGQ